MQGCLSTSVDEHSQALCFLCAYTLTSAPTCMYMHTQNYRRQIPEIYSKRFLRLRFVFEEFYFLLEQPKLINFLSKNIYQISV